MIRMMKKDGYHAEYAAALTAAVSILGPIIPPSISMVIYALAYPDINLVGLLIAGVVPGLVIALPGCPESRRFTHTEASVVAVFYALFAGRVIYRTLTWSMLPGILARSAMM